MRPIPKYLEFIGESKVDAANPFPQSIVKELVYHGSNTRFTEFEKHHGIRSTNFGNSYNVGYGGTYFTHTPELAAQFGKYVYACYINITEPFVGPEDPYTNSEDFEYCLEPLVDKSHYNWKLKVGLNSVTVGDLDQGYFLRWYKQVIPEEGLPWELLEQETVERMIEKGYDGSLVTENDSDMIEGGGESSYVVFEPENIKIVDMSS
jgi:hypothetical protein